jgi:hypothetical protein
VDRDAITCESAVEDDQEAPLAAETGQSAPLTEIEHSSPLPATPLRTESSLPGEAADTNAEHEETVEDYMARLLERMRGTPQTEPSDDTDEQVADGRAEADETPYQAMVDEEAEDEEAADEDVVYPPQAAAQASPSDSPTEVEPEDAEPTPIAGEQYRPRKQAPESKSDLGALRELANSSARSAIDHHQQQQRMRKAFGRLVIAGVALIGGVAFFFLQSLVGYLALTGTVVSVLLAVIWGCQAVGIALATLRLKQPCNLRPAAEDDSPTDTQQPQDEIIEPGEDEEPADEKAPLG